MSKTKNQIEMAAKHAAAFRTPDMYLIPMQQ